MDTAVCQKHQVPSFKLSDLRFLLLVLLPLSQTSCRLTDHDDGGQNDITPESINVPASGYDPQDPAEMPHMKFDSVSLDMGRILQGAQGARQFHFVNDGRKTLLITSVSGSCGCTVAKDWPREPVKPGERGTITVNFDSHGRSGRQEKVVTIVANTTPASTVLFLHGDVIAPEQPKENNHQ